MIFQPEVEFHNYSFKEWKFIVLAQVFFHYHKLEVANRIAAGQAFIPADNIHFFIGYKIFNYFTEHKIYPWLHPESKTEINPDNIIWNDMFYFVFRSIWVIYGINVYEPVNVSPFGFSI